MSATTGPAPPAHDDVLHSLLDRLAGERVPVGDLLASAAEQLARAVGDTCVASLRSADGRWLAPVGLGDPDRKVAAVLGSLLGRRISADPGFTRKTLSRYAERFAIGDLLVVPMRSGGRVIGQVALIRRREGRPYTEEDERRVRAVADLLALGVRCAGIEERAPAPPPDVEQPSGLSAREREVLALIALGHTNREVAERLHLSVRTVEWHRARIQWKLGVTGRAALARLARTYRLID